MSESYQPVSLGEDEDERRQVNHRVGLLGTSHLSRITTQGNTEAGYSQIPDLNAAQASPALASNSPTSPVLSSPGLYKTDGIRDLQRMRHDDSVMKQRIRYFKFFLRVFTLALAIYSLVTMAYTLKRFIATRNYKVIIRNSAGHVLVRGPWFKETKLWPTLLLATTSSLSLLLNLVVVIAYLKSVRTANTTSTYFTYVSYIISAVHVGMWIPTAAAYRIGKTGEDLWGWSCSEKAAQIQPAFKGIVDFERACNVQTSAWGSSLAEAFLMIFTALLWWWEYRRLKHQRDMQTHFTEDFQMTENKWSKMVPTGHKI